MALSRISLAGAGARRALAAAPVPGVCPMMSAMLRRAARGMATAAGAEGSGAASAAAAAAPRKSPLKLDTPQSLSLSTLKHNPGAHTPKRRKGRGEGSGMGKYATRGMKGTKSRAGGGVKLGFEGGQSPLWRRTPKIGYMPASLDTPWEPVNLLTLQRAIDTGRIDAGKKITMKTLLDAGIVSRVEHGVKLLGSGADRFTARVDIEVSQASASAIAAVEKAGGRVKAVYYNKLALRAVLRPHKFPLPIKSPRPPTRLLAYYSKWENRGYLCPEVQLAEIKARLAAGQDAYTAAAVMPAYAGEHRPCHPLLLLTRHRTSVPRPCRALHCLALCIATASTMPHAPRRRLTAARFNRPYLPACLPVSACRWPR